MQKKQTFSIPRNTVWIPDIRIHSQNLYTKSIAMDTFIIRNILVQEKCFILLFSITSVTTSVINEITHMCFLSIFCFGYMCQQKMFFLLENLLCSFLILVIITLS